MDRAYPPRGEDDAADDQHSAAYAHEGDGFPQHQRGADHGNKRIDIDVVVGGYNAQNAGGGVPGAIAHRAADHPQEQQVKERCV